MPEEFLAKERDVSYSNLPARKSCLMLPEARKPVLEDLGTRV